jgi:hypothetical protein
MFDAVEALEIMIVGVDQNHFLSRSLPAIAISSISSASRNALSMLIPGSTPPRDTGLIL